MTSPSAGTSGSASARLVPVVASARSLPALMWPIMPAVPGIETGTWPASRSAVAAVRDVVHLEPGHRGEHRREQVLAAAVARRRVVDLARMLLHIGDELGD